MTLFDSPEHRANVVATARRLAIDAASGEVLDAYGAAGVETLVLKGVSLTGWLYKRDQAHYLDIDLLVRPGHEERAGQVLRELQFGPVVDDDAMPGWWREHAAEWLRPADLVRVDLHRRLAGVGVDSSTAWSVLAGESEAVVVGGISGRCLSRPARLMHVVLHAAHHGIATGKAIAHVDRAREVVDDELWRQAAELAARLEARDAFSAGLRLTPAGAALADRLRLPGIRSVEVALRAATPPPVALGFEQLASAPGLRARAAIILRKLVPPRTFIVHWYPHAASSRTALALAYIRRPIWVLRNAPRGFRAWRRARLDVRR